MTLARDQRPAPEDGLCHPVVPAPSGDRGGCVTPGANCRDQEDDRIPDQSMHARIRLLFKSDFDPLLYYLIFSLL